MKKDFRIFIKYVFNFKGFLEGFITEIQKMFAPKRFSIILFFVAAFAFIKLTPPNNGVAASILLVFALMIHLRSVYKGGEHRHWYRKKIGMKSKKEILRTEKPKPTEKEDEFHGKDPQLEEINK